MGSLRSLLPVVVAAAISLFVGAALAKPDGTSTMPSKRPADYEVGKRLWAQSCWQCHGTSGKGDGPAAAALPGGVPSLEGKTRAEDIPRMVAVVQAGKGRMPAYSEDIDEHDTRRTLVYIKDVLEGRKPPPAEKDAGGEDASEGQ